MNSRVTELTEMALQIRNYQMYDQNGTPTYSLSQVIQPHLMEMQDTGEAAALPDQLECNKRDEEQFMAEFGISNATDIMENPIQFVNKQMEAFFRLVDARIMQTKMMKRSGKKAEDLRAQNLKDNEADIRDFTKKIQDAIYTLEVDVGPSWSQTDQETRKAKERELLEVFKMLIYRLKTFVDDIPDDWRELDKILHLMKATHETFKPME